MKCIFAVVNRRGGVGKTVTAYALGAGIERQGQRVLFIDLDSQCNLSYDMGAASSASTSMDVLTGTASISEAIQHTANGDIVPASPFLASADIDITGTGKEYRLKKAIEPVEDSYDYIVIDTPPSLGILNINALTACHRAVIPAQAEVHSLQGIGQLYEVIETVKKYTNPHIAIAGILVTRFQKRAILSRDMLQNLKDMAKSIGTKVFATQIRECVAIKEAQATQQSIFAYAPRSNGARDYQHFINEVLQE